MSFASAFHPLIQANNKNSEKNQAQDRTLGHYTVTKTKSSSHICSGSFTCLYSNVIYNIKCNDPDHTATLILLHCFLMNDFLVLIGLAYLWIVTSLSAACDNNPHSELDLFETPKNYCSHHFSSLIMDT